MHSNPDFLKAISRAFNAFLAKGTSRSNDKLKPLHGAIAKDLADYLGQDYEIISQGYKIGKEAEIKGRYIDKKVDITVTKNGRPIAGIGVKFVMQNYSQNSNNYFENMLGETANIRSADFPYFQVFIIFDKLPYYRKDKSIMKWETLTAHNIQKYRILSKDNAKVYFHTPDKTLLYVVHLPEPEISVKTKDEYLDYYRQHPQELSLSKFDDAGFESAVIMNDYKLFLQKVYHTIMAR